MWPTFFIPAVLAAGGQIDCFNLYIECEQIFTAARA